MPWRGRRNSLKYIGMWWTRQGSNPATLDMLASSGIRVVLSRCGDASESAVNGSHALHKFSDHVSQAFPGLVGQFGMLLPGH